jgi:hypothetical protein
MAFSRANKESARSAFLGLGPGFTLGTERWRGMASAMPKKSRRAAPSSGLAQASPWARKGEGVWLQPCHKRVGAQRHPCSILRDAPASRGALAGSNRGPIRMGALSVRWWRIEPDNVGKLIMSLDGACAFPHLPTTARRGQPGTRRVTRTTIRHIVPGSSLRKILNNEDGDYAIPSLREGFSQNPLRAGRPKCGGRSRGGRARDRCRGRGVGFDCPAT